MSVLSPEAVDMGAGIDLSTLSRLTGVPQGTLRSWVSVHQIPRIPRSRPAHYRITDLNPHLMAWADRQRSESQAA